MRVDYADDTDLEVDRFEGGWFPVAQQWLGDAIAAAVPEPNAIVLGTVDESGHPATRTVLCKGLDADGVVFYTNYESDKGVQLARTPYASITFPWIAIARQLTIRGAVKKVSAESTAKYFATRPRGSQLGAWASHQSRPVASRAELEAQLAEVTARFDGADVPVPPNWGGFRVIPETVEFWQGRTNRLHNRIRVTVASSTVERLQP
ncbi:pyridoxamine 5'-phosphate oxidase [Rhodococcoides yunnanense]|uniref:pyridoxamine 5'-phosphate oxidase n=1 Tax=Rhodococcoides yunnanense TaxID=278209 RepID=UPI000932DCB1|nr:pyridoxamine 5'-phosphate oxidase [Rhodococcus yunnanensis]